MCGACKAFWKSVGPNQIVGYCCPFCDGHGDFPREPERFWPGKVRDILSPEEILKKQKELIDRYLEFSKPKPDPLKELHEKVDNLLTRIERIERRFVAEGEEY